MRTYPPKPDPAEAALYRSRQPELVAEVDRLVASDPGLRDAVGDFPWPLLADNHRHHGAFIGDVLQYGWFELLDHVLPWAYRSYGSRGIRPAYFPIHLRAWRSALDTRLGGLPTVRAVYDWILARHERTLREADSIRSFNPPVAHADGAAEEELARFLVVGDREAALGQARRLLDGGMPLTGYFDRVIRPAMYRIGGLWEAGTITEAHEHLASTVLTRILTELSLSRPNIRHGRDKALVAVAPDEHHEFGAWMVADALQEAGWQVRYLGANTPQTAFVAMAADFKPDLVALSATMPFNLGRTGSMVAALRERSAAKILVGGLPFNLVDTLWRSIGADGSASSAAGARDLAGTWR